MQPHGWRGGRPDRRRRRDMTGASILVSLLRARLRSFGMRSSHGGAQTGVEAAPVAYGAVVKISAL